MHGRDVLGVMPTGAGKSICYQVPAMLLPGVTLVISPLISLMRDQVQGLVANGVAAAFINSSLTDKQWSRVMSEARLGRYKIIYIAPERLLAATMLELAQSIQISLIAVDEAHCISQWGQDFRPSYLDIIGFLEKLPAHPVLGAFTATATPRVRQDILRVLQLENPLAMVTGFDRPNLYFEVRQPKDKYASLVQYLSENDGNGIVYCSTRKEVEGVSERLIEDGYSAARYHAGLSDNERTESQDDFLYDRVRIIVATNAFGMGIDKSNVRFVIHYNMPQNVESYYQEAGRAGRDGLPSNCILFYSRKDISTALFLINQSENPDEIARNRKLLGKMEHYCETYDCLRKYMLLYFGEDATDNCGNCGNCNGSFDQTDVTVDAQKILSHILRLNRAGKRFMFTHTADIILGKSDDFTDLPTFGIMKGSTRRYIRSLINRLTSLNYICDDGYLSATAKASEVLFDGVKVSIRGNGAKGLNTARAKDIAERPKYVLSEALFIKLKKLRFEIAQEEKVPAFVIFSDATLVDMCQKHPVSMEEMLSVSGIGQVKLERYGERFLQLLKEEKPNTQLEEKPSELSVELLCRQLPSSDELMTISRIADHINTVLIQYGKPKTTGASLNKLLIACEYLEVIDDTKLPTSKGLEIGITPTLRTSKLGNTYTQCLFSIDAQQVCAKLVWNEISHSAEFI